MEAGPEVVEVTYGVVANPDLAPLFANVTAIPAGPVVGLVRVMAPVVALAVA